jgi:hypothetical protein
VRDRIATPILNTSGSISDLAVFVLTLPAKLSYDLHFSSSFLRDIHQQSTHTDYVPARVPVARTNTIPGPYPFRIRLRTANAEFRAFSNPPDTTFANFGMTVNRPHRKCLASLSRTKLLLLKTSVMNIPNLKKALPVARTIHTTLPYSSSSTSTSSTLPVPLRYSPVRPTSHNRLSLSIPVLLRLLLPSRPIAASV